MQTLPYLPLLLVLLVLGACGEQGSSPEPAEAAGAATTPPAATAVLLAREAPLGQGDLAPLFTGLPEGKTVVVFYRGPW